jgi:GH15 family glucan-1,4-alpha-glucosidase
LPLRIEDYALIGDLQTGALIGRDGSIDWLCLPRFDAGACFAALLGDERNGRWLLAPAGGVKRVSRRYREGTLVLETEWETDEGMVRVVDCMPPRERTPDLVRVVEGVRGRVPMRMQLVIRFDYGAIVPWVRQGDDGLLAIAGPDALVLTTPVETRGEDLTTLAEFAVAEGESVPFVLTWSPSNDITLGAAARDGERAVAETERWWRDWTSRTRYEGEWKEEAIRSLIVLKAMIYEPTGGIVASPTTSLPEQLGGPRNWDYRFCWLRDATFTLSALLAGGYVDEARAWRDWLLRAAAGDPAQLQILYGAAGERRLTELELGWLPGYERSRPVRVGNAAVDQFQLDVYGEVFDSLYAARQGGLEPEAEAWELQRVIMDHLESVWHDPDEGIWEVRGPRRHFTHSKVMAWVAFDRAVRSAEALDPDAPTERWRALCAEIHKEVCERGYDAERGAFTQYYGAKQLDASLLMMAQVGFLPATDERVRGTVDAIRRELSVDGFVYRYQPETAPAVDGLPPGEGAFLPCTFWLADNFALQGRTEEARAVCERVLSVRNDVGLLSEEYDPGARRLVGNFPQAFSHVALVNTAHNLSPGRARPRSAARRAEASGGTADRAG